MNQLTHKRGQALTKMCQKCGKRKSIDGFKKNTIPNGAGNFFYNAWCNACVKKTSRIIEL